jgi:hypothetical protein
MTTNNSQRAVAAPELLEAMTGSWVKIGTLIASPVIIIFDNQGTVAIEISTNGGTDTWKTFVAGQALVLDMRSNHGNAPNFAFDEGTTFYGNGASGNFSISYIYAKNN